MTEGELIVRRAAAAFNAADAEAFAELADPDFLFVPLLTRSASGEPYRGPAGARDYVRDAHAWAATSIAIRDVADHGDVVVAHGDLSLSISERRQVLPVVYVARIREGLVTEMATLADVALASGVLGLEPPLSVGPVLHIEVAAVPASVPPIRAAVREFARSRQIEDVEAVALTVTEAASNVVLHAYVDADEQGPIVVTGTDDAGGIVVSVADEGRGLLPRTDSPGLGMGLRVMQRAAAEVSFRGPPQRDAGTEVRLRFERSL